MRPSNISLHNGVQIPEFGLGVFKVEEGTQIEKTIGTAIDLGYRLIDTATFYENEEGVGRAVREASVPREELFVTTKVWNSDQGYDETLRAFETSQKKLGLDVIDLYLIHWPVVGKYKDTWRALERLHDEGSVRAIGVSNFQTHHLEDLMARANEKPTVNQVELHPLLSQEPLREFCAAQDIKVEAWSPISRGRFLENPTLLHLSEKYGKTPAQLILRWHVQHGIIAIPKSVTPARLQENISIFDFELSAQDVKTIDLMNENQRFGADPDNFDF
ncbi:aldo/keto reductase [Bacillus fonticola]|uniref:aldo/keto reductase n=1 Tax=Bacillus fonticola TaxID=2728853 RepID=UPI001473C366|nr:aldo/keto reductase [Bacillus fonticola]